MSLFKLCIFLFLVSISSANPGYSAPNCVLEKTCIPLNIENHSGQPLYALIYGSHSKKFYNFINSSYSQVFNSEEHLLSIDKDIKTIYLPVDGITGGARMYISTQPLTGIPDLATYPYIFDKIEMGWSEHTAGWNTTSVDFFGMPMQLIQGRTAVGFKDGSTRDAIIQDLIKNMGLESDLYEPRFFFSDGSDILRVFSPQHFYTNLPNLWEPAISQGIDELMMDDPKKGRGVYFHYTYGAVVYSHLKKLSNNSLLVDANGQTKTISQITTGNAAAGQIKPVGDPFAGLLAATINRGVLGNPAHWGQNGIPNKGSPEYYYQGNPGQYRYNTYAKVLIKHSIDEKAYATAYDDYWHMDSSLQVGADNNAPVTIKILPFHLML